MAREYGLSVDNVRKWRARDTVEAYIAQTEKNIECYRPEIGIKAKDFFKILGKKTRKKINKHDPIFYYNLT